MARNSIKKPRKGTVISETDVFKTGESQLQDIKRRGDSLDAVIQQKFAATIDEYLGGFTQLSTERDTCINKLSSLNADAARRLNSDERFLVPIPDAAIFDIGKRVVAFRPANDDSDDNSESIPRIPAAGNAVPGCAVTCTSAKTDIQQASPIKQRDEHPDSGVNLIRDNPCREKAINVSLVGKRCQQWVFEFSFDGQLGYFVMRCPNSACENPSFSKHPLKHNRARQHLRQCRMSFRSEGDMVRRYARLLTTGREDRSVSRTWARKYNSSLLAANEAHLEEENILGWT